MITPQGSRRVEDVGGAGSSVSQSLQSSLSCRIDSRSLVLGWAVGCLGGRWWVGFIVTRDVTDRNKAPSRGFWGLVLNS